MKTNVYKWMVVASLVSGLVACGGDAPGAGSTSGGSTTGGGTATSSATAAADISVEFSPPVLDNINATTANVDIQVVDKNRNVINDTPVTVQLLDTTATWSGPTTTGTTGTLSGVVNLGGDFSNRTVTLIAKSGDVTKQFALVVSGAELFGSVTTLPTAVGQDATVLFRLRKNDTSIPNKTIVLTSSLGNFAPTTAIMDSSGDYVFTYRLSVLGADVISATAGGATASVNVSTATTPIPTATPASLSIQANPVQISAAQGVSQVQARVLGAANEPVKNARVKFRIADPNSVGGSLSTTAAVTSQEVYTDDTGAAVVTYKAGFRTSPADGLSICAQVLDPVGSTPTTGITVANADTRPGFCTNTSEAGVKLTVATVPISVVVGTDNTIANSQGGLTYLKRFNITVANSAGLGQAGAQVSVVLDPFVYYKGNLVWNDTDSVWAIQVRHMCPNEDLNRNGQLDAAEDVNGNGVLEPRIPPVVRLQNNGVTDSNGQIIMEVEYTEDYAYWLTVNLTVSTQVAGSEGRTVYTYTLDGLASDYTTETPPPAGVNSPYGLVADCTNPN